MHSRFLEQTLDIVHSGGVLLYAMAAVIYEDCRNLRLNAQISHFCEVWEM